MSTEKIRRKDIIQIPVVYLNLVNLKIKLIELISIHQQHRYVGEFLEGLTMGNRTTSRWGVGMSRKRQFSFRQVFFPCFLAHVGALPLYPSSMLTKIFETNEQNKSALFYFCWVLHYDINKSNMIHSVSYMVLTYLIFQIYLSM